MREDVPNVTTVILGSSSRGDTLDAVLAHMVGEGMLPLGAAAEVREGIDRRHALGSTAIGGGVAIPHLKHPCAERYLMGLALLRSPNTDWESLDGEPVDIVLLIVAPDRPAAKAGARYFERLQRGIGAGLAERLCRATSSKELADVLNDFDLGRTDEPGRPRQERITPD